MRVGHIPGYTNLAMMELFGMIRIAHGKPGKGEGWRITRIGITDLGDRLLQALHRHFDTNVSDLFTPSWEEDDGGNGEPPLFDDLKPALQPLFPRWINSLPVPQWWDEPPPDAAAPIFRITLTKEIWRTMRVPAEATLDLVAGAILDAFAFDHDHLYYFELVTPLGDTVRLHHDYCDDAPYAAAFRVGELPLEPGERMTMVYDFGEQWCFTIEWGGADQSTERAGGPQVLESHGEPPEQYSGF